MCEEICLNRLNLAPETLTPDQVIEYARPFIFDFIFPIFDEEYRITLETKILKHFYFREIGLETPAQWKFYLNEVLNLEMPVLNKYYKSALLDFNPLYNVDLIRERHGDGTLERTGNENANLTNNQEIKHTGNRSENAQANGNAINISNNTVKQRFSDTPQNGLTDVENDRYLTSYQHNTSNGSDSNTSNSNTQMTGNDTSSDTQSSRGSNIISRNENANTTDHYIETVKGNQGGASFSAMIMEFRKSLINTDQMVFDALNPLFMGIY